MQNVQYSILIHNAANVRTCGVLDERVKRMEDDDFKSISCLSCQCVLLLFFYYILNIFQRQIVFVFKNITERFHLYMIYT